MNLRVGLLLFIFRNVLIFQSIELFQNNLIFPSDEIDHILVFLDCPKDTDQ